MLRLPLYPERPVVPVEESERLDVNRSCERCSLHVDTRTVCMGAEGETGGLLVVGESPGKNEDAAGRPFVGGSGRLLRPLLARYWKGPVALDNALRCAPGGRKVKDKNIHECRPYLARTIEEVQPTRIVALGGWAVYSLTGRAVSMMTTRRGYTWFYRTGQEPIPVFYVLHPSAALRNRFVRQWFEADLQWALTCEPPPQPPVLEEVRVVRTAEEALAARRELSAASWVAFDVETAGIMRTPSFRLLCVSFCAAGSQAPIAWDSTSLRSPAAVAELKALLLDPAVRKTGQNVKFDDVAIELTLGVRTANIRGDARLSRKLLDPEAEGKLDKMAELVGMGGMKEEAKAEMESYVERVRKARNTERRLERNRVEDAERAAQGLKARKRAPLTTWAQADLDYLHALDRDDPSLAAVVRDDEAETEQWQYALIPEDMLVRYNGRDSAATVRVIEWCEPQLKALPTVDRIREQLVEPCARAIRKVENWGVAVNREAMEALDSYCLLQLQSIDQRLAHYGDINLNSPKQVADLLFGPAPKGLGLRATLLTDSGTPSTSEEALEAHAAHPVVKDILDRRTYARLQGQYASGMLKHVRMDGRIHPSILLDGARSGRTSCQDPNLQNIPRAQSLEGKMARDCFVARPGYTLIEMDYSQIELRIAAALSQDPEMIAIFLSGQDYHLRTAQLVSQMAWGIAPEDCGEKQRSDSKSVNFGVLYGMGDAALAAKIKSTVKMAERIRSAIMGKFKVLDRWIAACLAEARKTGNTWTYWGPSRARRRSLWRIADEDDAARVVAENGAHNTPVQGSSSDFLLASLTGCVEWIEDDGLEDVVKLVLPVHDSIMFEARKDMTEETAIAARSIMLSFDSWGVPLEADCKVGDAWGSMQKAKFVKDGGRTRLVVGA